MSMGIEGAGLEFSFADDRTGRLLDDGPDLYLVRHSPNLHGMGPRANQAGAPPFHVGADRRAPHAGGEVA